MKLFLYGVIAIIGLLLVINLLGVRRRNLFGEWISQWLANSRADSLDFNADDEYWEHYERDQHVKILSNQGSVYATLTEIRRRRALAAPTLAVLAKVLADTPLDHPNFSRIVEQLCGSRATFIQMRNDRK